LEQELEAIIVRFEPVLKTRFLPWLQPGPPEEADRRGNKTARGPHIFNARPTTGCLGVRGGIPKEQRDVQGPLCAKAVARGPHTKSVALGPSYRACRPPQESRLAVAKAKSAPLIPIPNEQQSIQALAHTTFGYAPAVGGFDNRRA
jgi:hypothetical protein